MPALPHGLGAHLRPSRNVGMMCARAAVSLRRGRLGSGGCSPHGPWDDAKKRNGPKAVTRAWHPSSNRVAQGLARDGHQRARWYSRTRCIVRPGDSGEIRTLWTDSMYGDYVAPIVSDLRSRFVPALSKLRHSSTIAYSITRQIRGVPRESARRCARRAKDVALYVAVSANYAAQQLARAHYDDPARRQYAFYRPRENSAAHRLKSSLPVPCSSRIAHNPLTDDVHAPSFPPYSPAGEIDAGTLAALRYTNHEWQHDGGAGVERTHGGAGIDGGGGQDIHRLRYQYLPAGRWQGGDGGEGEARRAHLVFAITHSRLVVDISRLDMPTMGPGGEWDPVRTGCSTVPAILDRVPYVRARGPVDRIDACSGEPQPPAAKHAQFDLVGHG
ncbi:hypothetical protein VTO73DRAFT_5348 [Trametes versicolor]